MDVLNGLSDDQLALLGCGVALAATGLLMSVSVYVGRARNRLLSNPPAILRTRTVNFTGRRALKSDEEARSRAA